MKGVCWCVCVWQCVYVCAWGGEGGACILKLQQYSSIYYMYTAGLDRLVIHFYLKIHNSPFLIHFRPPNLPTTSNWCPAGMTHESAWLEQSRQRSGWSHPRRFREERWACVMLRPPCLTISSILDSQYTFILNIRLALALQFAWWVATEWLHHATWFFSRFSTALFLPGTTSSRCSHSRRVSLYFPFCYIRIPLWYLAFRHMLLFS